MAGMLTPPISADVPARAMPAGLPRTGVLRGAAYTRRTLTTPTADGGQESRWIAMDESGWNGEALLRPDEPYLTVGSVAIDDAAAEEIVTALRNDAGLMQTGELKFGQFLGRGQLNTRRIGVLIAALKPGGPLGQRSSLFLADKRYVAVAKIIDLLLEEYVHDHGGNLHTGDKARMAAWTLFNQGPRALGLPLFNDLTSRFTDFAAIRNRGEAQVTVAELFRLLDLAERRSRRRVVTQLLHQLCRCRTQAEELQRFMDDPSFVASLEPLTPSVTAAAGAWSLRLGSIGVLLDAHRIYTDDHLGSIRRQMSGIGPPDLRWMWQGTRVRTFVRGTSNDHPSIQLADLVAGAGRAVAHFHEGLSSVAAQAGELLALAVVPLIAAEGSFAHDEPNRFGARKATP